MLSATITDFINEDVRQGGAIRSDRDLRQESKRFTFWGLSFSTCTIIRIHGFLFPDCHGDLKKKKYMKTLH